MWFLAILGGYLTYTIVPAMIAFGATRRAAAMQLLRLVVAGSVVFALLAALGFLLEQALFAVMDWNQAVGAGRVYGASTGVHLIFTEMVLTLLVWTAAVVVVGVGFYRSDDIGWSVAGVIWIPVVLAGAIVEAWVSRAFSLRSVDITIPSGPFTAGPVAQSGHPCRTWCCRLATDSRCSAT